MPISRRRILSQSREELGDPIYGRTGYNPYEDDEDVWYSKEKLFKDHISEILQKWDKIDDEIWAKLIVLERNRRVAKAYARAPILTVNGSNDGFDGYRIGLNGFGNPMRDLKTAELKAGIGAGVKIKMDEQGNILIKRLAKSAPVVVRHWSGMDELNGDDTLSSEPALGLVSSELIHNGGALEPDKPIVLFDMKAFTGQVQRELMSAYPDRKRLEAQCISCIGFGRTETGPSVSADLLSTPCWVMLINIVAMDMLKSKLVPVIKKFPAPKFVTIFDKDSSNVHKIGNAEEDPYSISIAPSTVSVTGMREDKKQSANEKQRGAAGKNPNGKPPKLPPRHDLDLYEALKMKRLVSSHHHHVAHNKTGGLNGANHNGRATGDFDCCPTPTPDYESKSSASSGSSSNQQSGGKRNAPKKLPDWRDEDPYYCGFRARVPNYVKNPAAGRSTSSPPSRGLHSKALEQQQQQQRGSSPEKSSSAKDKKNKQGGGASSSRSSSDSSGDRSARVPFGGYLGNFFFSDRSASRNGSASDRHVSQSNSNSSSGHYQSLYGVNSDSERGGGGYQQTQQHPLGQHAIHTIHGHGGHSGMSPHDRDLYSNYRRVRHSQELFRKGAGAGARMRM